MKKLQENKKNDVISLLNTGKSVRQVAEILHVSKPIVGKIKKRCCRSLGVSKGADINCCLRLMKGFVFAKQQKTQSKMQVTL